MPTHTRTVEYPFDTLVTSLASNTRNDFSAITITIAETSGRTFRSVYAEVYYRDNTAAGTEFSSVLVGIKLGAVAFSDTTTSYTAGMGSADSYSGRFLLDVTSYFNSNFGGATTQTCQVGVKIVGPSTTNIAVKIVATYDYDETNTTRTKTIRIPIESVTGTLTNSLASIGTSQIPILTGGSGILTEASITVKDLWIEAMVNDGSVSATTNYALALALDAGGETVFGTHVNTSQSCCWNVIFWRQTALDTTTTHDLKARSNNLTARFTNFGALLCVTYTYDHSSTTSIFNSIELLLHDEQGATGGTVAGDQSRLTQKFFLEEPGSLVLKQSGFLVVYSNNNVNSFTFDIGAGSQTVRAYSPAVLPQNTCGQYGIFHRIDAGGAVGSAGITLARGENSLTINSYRTTGLGYNIPFGTSYRVWLNYTSSKASDDGVHNHTTKWAFQNSVQIDTQGSNSAGVSTVAAIAPVIQEANFWCTQIGYDIGFGHSGRAPGIFSAEILSGEAAKDDGWIDVRVLVQNVDARYLWANIFCDATWLFDRHSSDPNPLTLVLETARKYRMVAPIDGNLSGITGYFDAIMSVTYHSITISCSRSVLGYTGDGSGITVNIYRDDTKWWLYQATTIVGGDFTFVAFDNTINHFCEAYQDATHLGRSAPFTPS